MKRRLLAGITTLFCCVALALQPAAAEAPETTEKTEGVDYLILVNKENKIPDDWEKNITLVTELNCNDYEVQVEAETLEQFHKLQEDLLKENIDIELEGGYDSVAARQERLDVIIKERGEEGAMEMGERMGLPGYVDVHTGLSVLFTIVKDGEVKDYYEIDPADVADELVKIREKLPEYGFILRFPEGKEEITGFEYEPFHIRYVGSPEVAKEITDEGLTLEEYLAK